MAPPMDPTPPRPGGRGNLPCLILEPPRPASPRPELKKKKNLYSSIKIKLKPQKFN